MQAKGFFGSLFDYSFSSFVTPRIIKVLYVLATILISLWTLFLDRRRLQRVRGAGGAMLLIGGPLFFLFSMIYARVFLELVIVFFRINGNVQEIRDDRIGARRSRLRPGRPGRRGGRRACRASGTDRCAVVRRPASRGAGDRDHVAELSRRAGGRRRPATRYCENCGAERRPEGRFCTSCGQA